MAFTHFCVYFVITIIAILVTWVAGVFITKSMEDFAVGSWLASVLLLGVFITMFMVDHGYV